jgi:hypothetical protein
MNRLLYRDLSQSPVASANFSEVGKIEIERARERSVTSELAKFFALPRRFFGFSRMSAPTDVSFYQVYLDFAVAVNSGRRRMKDCSASRQMLWAIVSLLSRSKASYSLTVMPS